MKKYYFFGNANVQWTKEELEHCDLYLEDNAKTGRTIEEWIALSIDFGDLVEVEERTVIYTWRTEAGFELSLYKVFKGTRNLELDMAHNDKVIDSFGFTTFAQAEKFVTSNFIVKEENSYDEV